MSEELIKRIDEQMTARPVEWPLYGLLEDCRAALTRKYVPMTNDDILKLFAMNIHNLPTEVIIQMIEEIVIRRAGLEVQE